MKTKRLAWRWELLLDKAARSEYSSVALWSYGLLWAVVERGNIGFDGFLTLVALDVTLAVRRFQK